MLNIKNGNKMNKMNKMKFLFYVFVSAILCFSQNIIAKGSSEINIIPLPEKCKINSGSFVFNEKTKIVLDVKNEDLIHAASILNELFSSAAGFTIPVIEQASGSGLIVCKLNPSLTNDELYKLSIKKNKIQIEAKKPQGIFYAMQSIRQLLPPQIESNQKIQNIKWEVPCVEIEDSPRYIYRGLMLDCSRHFFTKGEVKQYIDLMAFHKMNTFHWHLTDDQGWRIEIKKYPKLTTVGGYRNRTLEGAYVSPSKRKWDNTVYGGFYTQEDVKEIIAYAKKRFVTVIPEIELPGHAIAALAAYPQYSCSGGPFEVEGLWGVHNDIFCSREETFEFLEGILGEVSELFPSQYIHIGGDEAPKLRWKRCYSCQERIKKEGLKDEHELQSYFVTRISKFLASKGKRIIGWDEILEGGLAPDATVMSWQGMKGGIEAAKQNHDVIMAPNSYVYLDYYQANPKTEPHAIGGYLPIWKVYSCNPTPKELTPDEAKHIIGFQGNLWTEYIKTFSHALYMAYPRAAAVAEVGWTADSQKNYDKFQNRLMVIMKHYDMMGINYNKTFLTEERKEENK